MVDEEETNEPEAGDGWDDEDWGSLEDTGSTATKVIHRVLHPYINIIEKNVSLL